MSEYKEDIKSIYQTCWRFMLVCPLLFLVPAGAEFFQHVAEIQIGMYASAEAFKALAFDPARQMTGVIKITSLSLPGYWFVRYLGFNENPMKARKIESPAILLWLGVLCYSLAFALPALFPDFLAAVLGMESKTFLQGFGIVTLVASVVGVYLIAWVIAWPLGNASIGWFTSAKLMNGHFIRAIVYMLAAVGPLMAVHYGLGHLAIGANPMIVWLLLTFDSLLVGILALMIAGATYFAVDRASSKKGVSLIKEI